MAPTDPKMKATAARKRATSFTHRVGIRRHQLLADEPAEKGGDDEGPTPQELLAASLASCVAITVEMYAKRKGWELGLIEVECEYELGEPGSETSFTVVLRLPSSCSEEQVERLKVIAGKCPVHRTLAGPVTFDERVELVEPAGN
jgi:putative redox protein